MTACCTYSHDNLFWVFRVNDDELDVGTDTGIGNMITKFHGSRARTQVCRFLHQSVSLLLPHQVVSDVTAECEMKKAPG